MESLISVDGLGAANIQTVLLVLLLSALLLLVLFAFGVRWRQNKRRLALLDQVTELPNRLWLHEHLSKVMPTKSSKHKLALLAVDLDNFRQFNDEHGHHVGDRLLRHIARRLASFSGENWHVARMGSDEFAVVLPKVHTRDEIVQAVHTIEAACRVQVDIPVPSRKLSATIGIAISPRDGTTADLLQKSAEFALMQAKLSCKGSFLFFNSESYESAQFRATLELELRAALKNRDFVIHYQPRIDVATGVVSAFEALVRWQHADRGMISPDILIPLAESTGMIRELGVVILDLVCADLARWCLDGLSVVPVSINVSARQFADTALAKVIGQALAAYGLAPELLEVELTESAMMGDTERALKDLQEVRRLGIKLFLDDFGTGYSSLSLLHKLEMDGLKIDRSFTSQLDREGNGRHLTISIVSIAKTLGMRVVAEGVETVEQLQSLRQLECDEVQGYLFSRPVPAERVPEILSHPAMLEKSA